MALSLNYPSPFGGEAFTYFIVGEVHESRFHRNASVVMYGFVDHAARQASAAYVPVTIAIDSEQWIKDATIEQIYDIAKATPAFADAVDA